MLTLNAVGLQIRPNKGAERQIQPNEGTKKSDRTSGKSDRTKNSTEQAKKEQQIGHFSKENEQKLEMFLKFVTFASKMARISTKCAKFAFWSLFPPQCPAGTRHSTAVNHQLKQTKNEKITTSNHGHPLPHAGYGPGPLIPRR